MRQHANKMEEQFGCIICYDVKPDLRELKCCCKLICQTCLGRMATNACPHCRKKTQEGDVAIVKGSQAINRMVREFFTNCKCGAWVFTPTLSEHTCPELTYLEQLERKAQGLDIDENSEWPENSIQYYEWVLRRERGRRDIVKRRARQSSREESEQWYAGRTESEHNIMFQLWENSQGLGVIEGYEWPYNSQRYYRCQLNQFIAVPGGRQDPIPFWN